MYADPEIYSESDSAKVKARKMSREIKKERSDTSGGNRVSQQFTILIFIDNLIVVDFYYRYKIGIRLWADRG